MRQRDGYHHPRTGWTARAPAQRPRLVVRHRRRKLSRISQPKLASPADHGPTSALRRHRYSSRDNSPLRAISLAKVGWASPLWTSAHRRSLPLPVSDDEARPRSGCSGGPAHSGMVVAILLTQFSAQFRPCNRDKSFLVMFATGKPSQTERDEKSESRPWSSR